MKDKPSVLLEKLKMNKELQENEEEKNTLKEMEILIKFLKIMEIEQYCTFNLSLARGLDYYTGLIYETVIWSRSSSFNI